MAELVKIEDTELTIREYNGQRVVTFKDIDTVHKNKSGTAYRNFSRNRKHFIEGTHFFVLKKENSNVTICHNRNIVVPNKGLTVLTERGYLLVAKSFNDDLSWKVQDQLVDTYFKARESINTEVLQAEPMEFPMRRTSSTPVPRNPSFYIRNRRKINKLCDMANITLSVLYHHILMRVGEEYDLTAAEKIYETERGYKPVYPMDMIDYFPELSRLAEEFLNGLIKLESSKKR